MKTTLFLFLVVFAMINTIGQDLQPADLNFTMDSEKKVIWQKVFELDMQNDSLMISLKDYLGGNLFTSKLSSIDNGFVGQSAKVKLSSTKSVAMGAYSPYEAFVKVEVKDSRYRVTVTDIVFDGMETGVSSGGFSISSTTPLRLADFVVKNNKNEFRSNNTAMSLLEILNKDLLNYFTIKEMSTSNDW